MLAIALCLVTGACGSPGESRAQAPDNKTLSDPEPVAPEPAATEPMATESIVDEPIIPEPIVIAPRVTTATFEPLYRAARTIQGATASGVTFVKFGELMQSLSTEIGIAKGRPLNAIDRKLLALYEKAFTQYQLSATLWRMENKQNKSVSGDSPERVWGYAATTLNQATAMYLGKETTAR